MAENIVSTKISNIMMNRLSIQQCLKKCENEFKYFRVSIIF